ncbi:MAG: glycosyltransferase [Candidatus Daviesbacteria bacterium]|nr:glycosyltransferase [Candidatus Daviesbacteria bacterium]
MKLSIVIPAYNEAKNLKRGVLDDVYDYLKNQNYNYEVLIVDDGSSDSTVKLVEAEIKNKKGIRLIKNQHGGKAITVITGLLESIGDIVLFTDMDQATPLNQIEKIFPKFDNGFDIVIGSRKGREGAPPIRKLMGWSFSVLRGLMLGLPFTDTQCGFKAFNKKSIKVIFPDLLKSWKNIKASGSAVNAGFDVETLFIARKKGFKIAEVLVDWRHVGSERVQAVKDSLEALKDMVRIKVNDIQGKY